MDKILFKRQHLLAIILILAFAGSFYFRATNQEKFGFYHDDGIYLETAKALATGQGYKILSLPDEPRQTKYPPFYPLALSILWRTNPDFPNNLPLFFAFSIFGMLAFQALTSAYLVKKSYASPILVLLILLFTAFNWRIIILATSVLSEALYATLTVCVLWLASSQGNRPSAAKGLCLGILVALTALTRLAGISLLAAVLFYALTGRKLRRFLFPIVLSSSIIAGWFLWCSLHQSSMIGSQFAYYTNYFQDWYSMISSSGSEAKISFLGSMSLMIGKNFLTMLSTIPVVCFGMEINKIQTIPQAWQFPAILIGLSSLILLVIGFYKTRSVENGLLHYYILAYLAMHLLWPYTIYDRFLIPILPFLLLFILSGGAHLLKGCFERIQTHKRRERIAFLAFLCAILASLFIAACLGLTSGIRNQIRNSNNVYEDEARGKHEMMDWLKANTRTGDILICYQDPVYFLYTGIKAIRLPPPNQQQSITSYADRLQGFIEDNKATLLLQTASDFSLESHFAEERAILANALNFRRAYFAPVYSNPTGRCSIYRIMPFREFDSK